MRRSKKNKGRKQSCRGEQPALELSIDTADVEAVGALAKELGSTLLGLGVCLEGIKEAIAFAERHVVNKRTVKGELIGAGNAIYAYVERLATVADLLGDAQKMGPDAAGKTLSRRVA